MGAFAEFRKNWEDAKKKAPEPALAKKAFSKGMGPALTELDAVAKDLATARGKAGWNPETIALLSPKVVKLCGDAKAIADEYQKIALKQPREQWKALALLAGKISSALATRAETENKEWRPTKEYIVLWRRATLELALSAAGLADAKSAEDLRQLLQGKTAAINKGRGDEEALRAQLASLTRGWRDADSVKSEGPYIAGKVAQVLKDPKLAGAADEARERSAKMVARKTEFEGKLKALKAFVAKSDVQKSTVKAQADQAAKDGDAILKAYADLLVVANAALAKLPKKT